MKTKSIIISILILTFLEIFNAFTFWGKSFWLSFGISIVVLGALILWAVGFPFKKWISKEIITHSIYLVLPIIFYAASLFFLLLIQGRTFKHLFIIGSAFLFLVILLGIRDSVIRGNNNG